MKKLLLSAVLSLVLCLSQMTGLAVNAEEEINVDSIIGNLIANGTFEADTQNWSAEGTVKSLANDGSVFSSAKSMKLEGAGTASAPMSSMYQQETYEMSVYAKAVSENVTVTIKYSFAGKDYADIASASVSADGWTNIKGSFKYQDSANYTYKGAVINNGGGRVLIEVSGDCLIDEVIVKPADEKIIAAVSADNLGGWLFRNTVSSAGTMTYSAEEQALYGTNLQRTNVAVIYPLALEKGETYRLTAKVKKAENVTTEQANVYFGSTGNVNKINVSDSEWTDVDVNYTSDYPSNSADGARAGTFIGFAGLGSSETQLASLYIKNVSVSKVSDSAAAASAKLTASETITAGETVSPELVLSDASGARYKYVYNGVTAASGCTTDELPSYTAEAAGTLKISVTPFNAYGYGETAEKEIIVGADETENEGVSSPDSALNNMISGTFENEIPEGWSYNGVTASREIVNTYENSAGAMKLTGSGSVVIENIPMYYNEVYSAAVKIKSASDTAVTASLSVNAGGISKQLGEVSVSENEWSDISADFSRYSTTYKNVAAKSMTGMLTLSVNGDCYIDEFILKVSNEMLLSSNGIRMTSESDGITETAGFIKRGNAVISYDNEEEALKAADLGTIDNSAAQYTVIKKGSAYKLTAQIKAVNSGSNTKGRIYAFYNDVIESVTLTDEWKDIEIDIPAEKTSLNANDVIGSSVAFCGASGTSKADMYIRNVSLKEVVTAQAVPEITKVDIPSSALGGAEIIPALSADFSKVNTVGFKYIYKLNGVPVKAGYASHQSEIPSYNIPGDAEGGSIVTFTAIPMNGQGACGEAMTSNECSVIGSYTMSKPVLTGIISAGETVTSAITIKNNTSAQKGLAVIAVCYDGTVFKACGIDKKTIASGETETFSPSISLPLTLSDKAKIQMFVWEDNGNVFPMKPVCDIIKLQDE